MRSLTHAVVLGGVLLAAASCSTPNAPAPENRPTETVEASAAAAAITARIDSMIARQGLEGAAVIIRKDGATLYERTFGGYELDTRVQIASATKWITAALVMTAVERDGLSLDAPLSGYLPETPDDKTGLTLRQMLSHTSGLPADHALAAPTDIPMAKAVSEFLDLDLAAAPGTMVLYGGVSMQIAGAAVAEQTGKDWQTLFRERIAQPLGWENVTWDHPLAQPVRPDPANPNLGAGLHLSAADYIKFLEMMARGGVANGHRILSTDSVAAMAVDNTAGLDKSELPPTADPSWGYALGCWCEVMDRGSTCLVMHSAGAFGVMPWLDHTSGVYGVVVVKSRLPLVLGDIQAVRSLANELD